MSEWNERVQKQGLQAAYVMLRAVSSKGTGFCLPYLGPACHSLAPSAPHGSKAAPDDCDHEGTPPSIPSTCPW